MKQKLIIFAVAFAGALSGANVQPILSGLGKIIFPGTTPAATISASSGALTVAAGGADKNVVLQPTGTGCVQLFADSPAITLCDSSGQITVAAGGTDQNVSLTPSGAGWVNTAASVISTGASTGFPAAGFIRMDWLGAVGEIIAFDGGASAFAPLELRGSVVYVAHGNFGAGGNVSPGFAVDATGDVNASGVYRQGGVNVGQSVTRTMCKTGACATTCTIIFTGGIATGGTC